MKTFDQWRSDDLLKIANSICDRQDEGAKASQVYVEMKRSTGADADTLLPLFAAAESLCPGHRKT